MDSAVEHDFGESPLMKSDSVSGGSVMLSLTHGYVGSGIVEGVFVVSLLLCVAWLALGSSGVPSILTWVAVLSGLAYIALEVMDAMKAKGYALTRLAPM